MAKRLKCYMKILVLSVCLSAILFSSGLISSGSHRHIADVGGKLVVVPMSPGGESQLPTYKATVQSRTPKKPKRTTTLSYKKLPEYNPSFRTPCWYDKYNNKTTFRCFPYVYLAGFPQAGSTDLYGRIVAHPLIIGGSEMAPQYLSRTFFDMPRNKCFSNFDCDSVVFSSRYFSKAAKLVLLTNDTELMNSTFLTEERPHDLTHRQVEFVKAFPRESMAIWNQAQRVNKYPVDGSPSYSWHVHNFQGVEENVSVGHARNSSADWIRALYSGAKIVMILRDPVQRAFDDYRRLLKAQSQSFDFHRRVLATTRRIKQCLQGQRSELHCTAYDYTVRLQAGMYPCHLQNWFEKFPRRQILILRYEDYMANISGTLARVFEFLEIPAISQQGLEFMSKFGLLNESNLTKAKMFEETRALLTKFYKPYNERLARLMGDDKFLWHNHTEAKKRQSK